MFEGPLDQLRLTENSQPAIFTASAMVLAAMEELHGIEFKSQISCAAGHSLGEYTALLFAGSISFSSLLFLLQKRARAMHDASPKCEKPGEGGAMCAILGIEFEKLQEIIENYTNGDLRKCVIANDNCPGQIVISGLLSALEAVRDIALQTGARKGIMLPVSGPFHSVWMQPASDKLKQALESVEISDASIPVISNYTARPMQKVEEIKELLPKQISGMLRWRESIEYMYNTGVLEMLEIGNGTVLTGLAKRCVQEIAVSSLQTSSDVCNFKLSQSD
jgi:[acyl-carrier-protein] S-malonyltransferase